MSGSSDQDQTVNIRYAPYIETKHKTFLDLIASNRSNIIYDSPYSDFNELDIESSFFGAGYVISNFPSLYDMFGKFMVGLDLGSLWSKVFTNAYDQSEVNETVLNNSIIIEDNKTEITDFQLGMRNINAVSTSSFIIGKAILEDKKIKAFSQRSLISKLKILKSINQDFNTRLNWGRKIVINYALIMKEYFLWTTDYDDTNYVMTVNDKLWPFTVLDFERAALRTMQGMESIKKSFVRDRSTISKALLIASYTASGAFYGSYFGPWGTGIGAVIGTFVGIAQVYFE